MARIKWPNREILHKSAEVCRLAYKKEKDFYQWQKDWMEDCGFCSKDNAVVFVKEKNPKIDYPKEQRLFFGIRGTQLKNGQDILDDITILKSLLSDCTDGTDGGSFHKGFKKRSKRCWKIIFDKLEGISMLDDLDKYEIILCGHSLGGAAAAVTYIRMKTKRSKARLEAKGGSPGSEADERMALEYNAEEDNIETELTTSQKIILRELPDDFHCITFGAPTFGNARNKQYCAKKRLAVGIFNVIHERDPVPRIFFHIPTIMQFHFVIQADSAIGNYEILKGDDAESEIYESSFSQAVFPKSIEDRLKADKLSVFNPVNIKRHKIKSYIACMANSTSARVGNTELDKIQRTNNDIMSVNKPYRASEIIGEGSYGLVMKGKNAINNQLVAIKKIKHDIDGIKIKVVLEDNDGKEIQGNNEIDSLLKLKNKNIVQLIDHFQYNQQKIYLIFEYCPLGSLRLFMVETRQLPLAENDLRLLLKQTLDGIVALHNEDIIHRDIKPGNILVTNSIDDPVYKLADLGSSTQYEGRTKTMTATGTKLYMSPEVFQAFVQKKSQVRLNPKTDVFSLGTVALFCLKVGDPWTENEFHSFADVGTKNAVKQMLSLTGNQFSSELEDITTEMVNVDRHARPTAENLLNHPFMIGDRAQVTK